MGKMDNNNKTSHFGKREHSGRQFTATKTNRRRIRLPKRTNLRTSTSRRKTAEKRQREQRNIKGKVDWKNQCQAVEDQGPMILNSKWDEVDNKVKSLIYLSLGTEGTNIFNQRNPHTDLSKCTTDAPVIQLQDTFKEIRNETFDRFQFFRCTQNPGESLEQFHSRIKQKAALCSWEDLEDSLVKSIFIQGMSNPQIQMDLLSENRDPLETLHYAITRE